MARAVALAPSQRRRCFTRKPVSPNASSPPLPRSPHPTHSPGQVSTRPAAEKPAVPPSPKKPKTPPSPMKKPDGSGRSADRNHGIPSEPNPKAPSTLKSERVAAGKRAKDDDAAEEQPEPKKKSASEGKKHIEKEAASSNPRKKRLRKQPQESAAVVAVLAPSAKNSPPKSSKKTVHLWTENDETVIMHGFEKAMKETRDMLTEFTRDVKKLIENSKAQTRTLLDSHLGLANGTRGAGGGGAGRRLNWTVLLGNGEPDLEGIYSIWEIPVVDKAKVELIEGILPEVRILQLEVSSHELALLQEECSMQIEALKETSINAESQ